jgi:hypothetical protein
MHRDGCAVCGAEKHLKASTCPRCKHILDRVETRRDPSGAIRHVDRQARLRALQESWRDGTFRCFYTDVALVDDSGRARDHRYLVFDHRTPGDEGSVVVTCALVNRLKTDLTEEQFKVMVTELAKVFAGGAFDERAFPEGVAPCLRWCG